MPQVVKTTDVLKLPGVVNSVSLAIPEHLTFEQWMGIGSGMKAVEKSIMFWIGDWLLYGENHFGEKWTQVLEATEYSYKTIQNALWVAKRIDPQIRREDVSYAHHAEIAALSVESQEHWLKVCAEERLTREGLRERLRAERKETTGVSAHKRSLPKEKTQRDQALRDDAEHEDCIRCSAPNAVSAHYSGIGKSLLGGGMGLKSHDIATAHLCQMCHAEFDSYEAQNSYERGWEFLVLILRTIVRRIEKGTIVIP